MPKVCDRCNVMFTTEVSYVVHDCFRKDMAKAINSPIDPAIFEKKDAVNPDHYKGDTTMVYLENVMTPEMVEGFLVGNVLKYVSRYHNKNGVEDLEKANWYLARLIKRKSI